MQRRWAGSKSAVWKQKSPRTAACWLGDQLELWSLPFGRLFARRALARLYVVGPCLQRDAPPLDHLAVPIGQLRLVADQIRQAELQHLAAEVVLFVVSTPIAEGGAAT